MFTINKDKEIDRETIINAIIYNENLTKIRYSKLQAYYLGQHPIKKRVIKYSKINNKVMTNHAYYITSQNVGYLMGNPVEYQTVEDAGENYTIDKVLDRYNQVNMNSVDVDIAQMLSIYGRAYDYTYVLDGQPKTVAIEPQHCVVIYDDTFDHNPLCALTYSSTNIEFGDNNTPTTDPNDVEVRDLKFIDQNAVYDYDVKVQNKTLEVVHLFRRVPVIEYHNNKQCMGDFEQVVELIDSYNILQSDRINDKEQLVQALLILKKVNLTEQQKEDMKIDRILSIPVDASAEYLIKQLDETSLDKLRAVLENDIHKISMTPNMTDENFVGNASGVAIRYKLLSFEQNIANKSRFFERGLLDRLELYSTMLYGEGYLKKYYIDVIFKRNLPQNDLEISEMILNLEGKVSQETLIGLLSFVENAEKEIEWAAEEKKANMDQMGADNGFGKPIDQADPTENVSNLGKKILEKINSEQSGQPTTKSK